MPEGFLCADAILKLAQNVTAGIQVNEKMIHKALWKYLPFIATENLMMEGVKKGGDRQELHELIRKCSMEAIEKMKNGEDCDLLQRLSKEPAFSMTEKEMEDLMKPEDYIGRCPEQVEKYLQKIQPLIREIEQAPAKINV